MNKHYSIKRTALLLVIAVLAISKSFSQQVANAKALVERNAAKIGLNANDLKNYRISDAYADKSSGLTYVYLQQTFKGIDVFNAIQTVAFKNEKAVSVTGARIGNMEALVNSKEGLAGVTAADAIKAAASHLKLATPSAMMPIKQMNAFKEIEFSNMGISSTNIKSKLLWVPDEISNKMSLSWQVQMQPKGLADLWYVNVDAQKGDILNKINLNIVCNWTTPRRVSAMRDISADITMAQDDNSSALVSSTKYRVIPFPAESPIHPGGAAAIVTNPWSLAGTGNNATTLQWHDNGTTTFDSTKGNNVLAQEDRNGNNGTGKLVKSTTVLPNLTFTNKVNFTKAPTTSANQKFAITNLFYWNNIMHDISYQYGFDEVSGNFQANNLGRGGNGNDFVFADAQDGSGTNNANFSTPNDGNNPRMQMFLFDGIASTTINQPTAFQGVKTSVESAFSTNNKLISVGTKTANVVYFNDDIAGTTHGACSAAANPVTLSGKIALIDRGTCGFTVKVKNAQLAGAIAAIVVDNIPGEYPIAMGGTDNTITIPAVMVSYETGDTIKSYLNTSVVVNATLKGGVSIDGDLDNGVISHEYTHGISNRLTGGPSNSSCLTNKEQMGEGWSDYFALMVTKKWSTATINDGANASPIGTYVVGQPITGGGIRNYPYSTNFAVNPWTYDSLPATGGEVHNIGEVWCNALWEMTWGIIQTAGINTNIYNASGAGGNSIALKLVTQGMKLQPCKPGFIDGRDAILKADTLLYGGVHSAAIWKAFAKRGMGIFASQGLSSSYTDGVADYTEPPAPPTANKGDLYVYKQSTSALLQWQNVANMTGNSFTVERSTNGVNYEVIGTVKAGKNANDMNTFTDVNPANGTNYYRLTQAAIGSDIHSAVRSINFTGVHITPNPAKDNITITIGDNVKALKVTLVTAAGKQIASYNMNSSVLNIKLPAIAPGMYFVKITGDGFTSTNKLIIQ
ncbi:M36 family metallopeptidase [Limnovirga soli]|uniref:T9SS type A sorting domain-containing protein n=1 Tax=Limnovirga soli TaxID=2656915 RepID=A0A8J8FE44_9BACT|nr:M36 family metallopeptidase [Limnovirga soli]NNV56396.1 T9SS type A sorting domain-containing protein [Limnovirga soli]